MICCVEFFPIEGTWLVTLSEDYSEEDTQIQCWFNVRFEEVGYEVSIEADGVADALCKAYPILREANIWRDELGKVRL